MCNGVRMKALWLLVCLALFGCAQPQVVKRDPQFASVRPAAIEPPPVKDGTIYREGHSAALFEDIKARRVGDIIIVKLVESTNATKSASTSTNKASSIDMADPTIFGKSITRNGNPILNTSIGADNTFTGDADSKQSNKLTGTVAVTVTDVLANGNLMVRGEKIITLNQGAEHVRLSGIVRSTDIAPDNSIYSSQIADAQIIYGGEGVIADANSMGWLQRFLQSPWWPF
ncbi:MAG: flagellar basal body L-ring protein [Gammaproteobacteria bacterium RBG_16_57_12]|nr:MAG: flagellar basal body L-ring protein [Gammaproteobacteria bacterium RBG_16_57_12]